MTTDSKTTPKHDVLGPRDYKNPVVVFGNLVAPSHVVGQISTHRLLLNYEIQFLHDAVFNIRRSNMKDLPYYVDLLEEKIQMLAKSINRALNDYGDTDPRHTEADDVS